MLTLDEAADRYRTAKARYAAAQAQVRWTQDANVQAVKESEEAKAGLEHAHEQLLVAANGGVSDALTVSRGRLGRLA